MLVLEHEDAKWPYNVHTATAVNKSNMQLPMQPSQSLATHEAAIIVDLRVVGGVE